MSLMQFLNVIADKLMPDPLAGKEAAISRLDPKKIYLENVRAALNVSTLTAQILCDTAVRRGVFSRAIEVVCPDGTVAISANREEELPAIVKCWQEDGDDFVQTEFETKDLKKVSFYRLTNVHRPTATA